MMRKVPLIVILGSTGTGKTKLSIELAQRFGGEVISADSMQVYKGLDIVTAKATQEEQSSAPHHCLDIVTPGQLFTVSNFRDMAVPIVDDLLSRSKIPIIVGGTNYYIESLLWKVLVSSPQNNYESSSLLSNSADSDDDTDDNDGDNRKRLKRDDAAGDSTQTTSAVTEIQTTEELLKMTTEQLYAVTSTVLHEHLKQIDPVRANRLHPNDKRKIIRAFEVFIQTGKKITDVYEAQRSSEGGSKYGGPLRYPHVIMFWLQCEQETLNDRLNKRVDSMVAQGLLPEIRKFYNEFKVLAPEQDYTKGILQTIGFKEFLPYLERYADADDSSTEAQECLNACLEELKLVTRRYSKKQRKWVKNRLVVDTGRPVPPVYSLDTTNITEWNERVRGPAEDVVDAYVAGREARLKPLERVKTPKTELNDDVSNYCETCERVFVGEYQWHLHLASNKHKKRMEGIRKRAKMKKEQEESTVS